LPGWGIEPSAFWSKVLFYIIILITLKIQLKNNQAEKLNKKLRLGVSICLDVISISTSKKSQSRQSRFSRQVLKTGLDCRDKVSTVETKSRQSLDWSRRPKVSIFVEISIEISISTPKKSQSRPSRKSRQVLKTGLDAMDVLDLDLDWSRLSRDPQAYKKSIYRQQKIHILI
jgi:hypothetical protein